MDVVYAVRRGNRNPELAYSLRSLVNLGGFNPDADRVWIIGHAPYWLRNVQHISTVQNSDSWGNCAKNWTRAVSVTRSISDPFIYMNDDFFIVEPVAKLRPRYRGDLAEIAAESTGNYARAMAATAKLLADEGKPTLCYETHTPLVVDKAGFAAALEPLKGNPRLMPRSIYVNRLAVKGLKGVNAKSKTDVLPDGPFLSSAESTWHSGAVGRRVRSLFPDPSRYEGKGATKG